MTRLTVVKTVSILVLGLICAIVALNTSLDGLALLAFGVGGIIIAAYRLPNRNARVRRR